MAGPSWLVDSNRIATKIKSASDLQRIKWKSNPTKACPNCQHVIDNSDVIQEWPGLPRGVKFDPSDQEILWHLLTKAGAESLKPHPFIDEFIPTVEEDDGICYTHPQNLPGVRQDGGVAHLFHRAIKAYNTGTRKRRKINGDDFGDVRWHKTGRTKPVFLDGIQRGCKKIMVLYTSPVGGGKPEKTNWVMHLYHLGTGEDEKEGEYVISKVFYQQQQVKQSEKYDHDLIEGVDTMPAKLDPVTPKSVTPEPLHTEGRISDFNNRQESNKTSMGPSSENQVSVYIEEDLEAAIEKSNDQNQPTDENHGDHLEGYNGSQGGEDKWWEGESQYLLDSQQLVEGLSLCDELLQSQSPSRYGIENDRESKGKPRLSEYANLGPEDLKKDLEECQNLVLSPANIELDTPPDFRLSQLEFGSQDSFLAWGGSKVIDR